MLSDDMKGAISPWSWFIGDLGDLGDLGLAGD